MLAKQLIGVRLADIGCLHNFVYFVSGSFIGSGCSESSAVSTFCGKPVYVPFFSGKIFFFFVISVGQQLRPYQTREFVCATVFFSVLICEEIERPLTLYRWFSFRRGFIFGISDTSVSTASVCVSDDWRTSTVPGLFLHSQNALCRQVFADIFVQCYRIFVNVDRTLTDKAKNSLAVVAKGIRLLRIDAEIRFQSSRSLSITSFCPAMDVNAVNV